MPKEFPTFSISCCGKILTLDEISDDSRDGMQHIVLYGQCPECEWHHTLHVKDKMQYGYDNDEEEGS
jgi:hypothetical protein